MIARQKAQEGLTMLKDAILAYLHAHPSGARHANLVEDLDLQSDFEGQSQNFLSYSVLGILMKEDKVTSHKEGRDRIFTLKEQ